MILFSIPVHEKPDVIINQIENFIFFSSECNIVLHVSAHFSTADFLDLKKRVAPFSNVFINSTRFWSGVNDGTIAKAHLSNCKFAISKKIDFQYVCLHASNDMFVKHGLADYLKEYDSGYYFNERLYTADTTWPQMIEARKDKFLLSAMQRFGLQHVLGCQVEGSFYSRKAMETILKAANRFINEIPFVYSFGTISPKNRFLKKIESKLFFYFVGVARYAKEEIYFPTFSQNAIEKRATYNYCYINWENNLMITREEIDLIRKDGEEELFKRMQLRYDSKVKFFAVKRVNRIINDPLRVYINSLK